jgi:hypothetical protein
MAGRGLPGEERRRVGVVLADALAAVAADDEEVDRRVALDGVELHVLLLDGTELGRQVDGAERDDQDAEDGKDPDDEDGPLRPGPPPAPGAIGVGARLGLRLGILLVADLVAIRARRPAARIRGPLGTLTELRGGACRRGEIELARRVVVGIRRRHDGTTIPVSGFPA